MAKWEQQHSLRKVLESLYSIGQNISHMAIQGELGNVVFISRGERDNRYLRIIHTVILVTVRNYFKLSLLSSSPPKSPFILPFFSVFLLHWIFPCLSLLVHILVHIFCSTSLFGFISSCFFLVCNKHSYYFLSLFYYSAITQVYLLSKMSFFTSL